MTPLLKTLCFRVKTNMGIMALLHVAPNNLLPCYAFPLHCIFKHPQLLLLAHLGK